MSAVAGSLHVTSFQNPKVKLIRKLIDRRSREKTGLFLIEGFRELSRACHSGHPIESVFYCRSLFLGINEETLLRECRDKGAALFSCTEEIFKELSYRDRPDGLIAIALKQNPTLDIFPLKECPLYVVAEAIEKPGNLGTILRSADGVGADGVIVCDRCTDIHNPNVVRASVGTLFTIPVVEAEGEEVFEWLKKRGVHIVAATPHAENDYTSVDFTGPLAIVVGTEQHGLSERWMQNADIKVKIPMKGVADSLNVATATTLLLYEVLRQRAGR